MLEKDCQAGDIIGEYLGVVIDRSELEKRMERHPGAFYFMALDKDLTLDARLKGNITRFINHSCVPNCEAQIWTVAGERRIAIVAAANLRKGTELTYAYDFAECTKAKCCCGEAVCRGWIGPALGWLYFF